jgi:hypothetical protein
LPLFTVKNGHEDRESWASMECPQIVSTDPDDLRLLAECERGELHLHKSVFGILKRDRGQSDVRAQGHRGVLCMGGVGGNKVGYGIADKLPTLISYLSAS